MTYCCAYIYNKLRLQPNSWPNNIWLYKIWENSISLKDSLEGKVSGDIVLFSSICKSIRLAKIFGNQIVVNRIQYTLVNPNSDVPILKKSVPISEFVRISEVTLFLWRFNNTKICDNPILAV